MTIHQHTAAGIDLGSNTFRLLVANHAAGGLRVLAKKMAAVRLGRGLDKNGLLHEDSMQKGLEVMRIFREILDRYQPQNVRACGTEALRRAGNSPDFLRQAAEILQQPIDIIDGDEEARLILAGASAGSREPLSCPLLLVDVGGGSTELIFTPSSAGETRVKSVPLGVVGLTERYTGAPDADVERLDRLIAEVLTGAFNKLNPVKKPSLLIIGCGGTATSMAALDLGLSAYSVSRVHGYVLQSLAIKKLWHRLIAIPADKRNSLPCLGDGRGEILPAGIRIYHVLLKLLQQDEMRVSDTGLLEGILLSSLGQAAP